MLGVLGQLEHFICGLLGRDGIGDVGENRGNAEQSVFVLLFAHVEKNLE